MKTSVTVLPMPVGAHACEYAPGRMGHWPALALLGAEAGATAATIPGTLEDDTLGCHPGFTCYLCCLQANSERASVPAGANTGELPGQNGAESQNYFC